MILIKYKHHRNIDNIYFVGGWQGSMYINTTPKASELKYIANVEVKNGVEITKSKIIQEEHTIRFIASDTMIMVLQKLPLLSDVRIAVGSFDEDKVYNLKFDIKSWLNGGSYAQCTLTYAIKTYADKNATIYNEE